MKSVLMLAAAASLAFVHVAAAAEPTAGASCKRPQAPAAIDGATATIEQMQAGKAAASDFMAASDTYQTCVLNDVATQKQSAKAAMRKFDPAVAKAGDAAIAANQADKTAVGSDFNTSLKAYKAAHPPT